MLLKLFSSLSLSPFLSLSVRFDAIVFISLTVRFDAI